MSSDPKKPDAVDPNKPDPVAAAQLRKLELEVDALDFEVNRKKGTADSEREKLALELQSLRRQNGLISRLTQVATVLTVLATIGTVAATFFGVWTAYDKFVSDKLKDTELRRRELAERTEVQFRSTLQQLAQYPVDDRQTISSAVFNFRDIVNVVEQGYEGEEREGRRRQVGFLLSQLTRSPEFDFKQPRNSEFDHKAMNYCDYYAAHLVREPGENLDVISKYKDALHAARLADPQYYPALSVSPEYIFTEGVRPRSERVKTKYISLFHGYKKHVELLVKSSEARPGDLDVKRKINEAFCWFYGSTANASLTQNIFGVEAGQVRQLWDEECR